jgi:hypothetical protein
METPQLSTALKEFKEFKEFRSSRSSRIGARRFCVWINAQAKAPSRTHQDRWAS